MVKRMKWLLAALCIASGAIAATTVKQEASLEVGRRAYEASEYPKAIQALQAAAVADPQNGDVQLLLAKSYLELQQHDPAIKSAEKAVAIDRRIPSTTSGWGERTEKRPIMPAGFRQYHWPRKHARNSRQPYSSTRRIIRRGKC